MIVGVIIEMGVGAALIVLGLLLWKKQMVKLIHGYQYRRVKKADIPAYTRLVGIGLILIGAGICITGLLNLFDSDYWWIPLVAGFVFGIITLHIAQKKYNGSWLS